MTEHTIAAVETAETETRRPTVLVLDRRGDLSEALARSAAALPQAPDVLRLRRTTKVAEVVGRSPVDVIVAGPSELTPTGLRRLGQVHRDNPKVVIVLTQNGKPVAFDDAVSSGASEVLPFPAHGTRIRNTLQRAVDAAQVLQAERIVMQEAPAAPVTGETKLGQVFTITSASGGCGKTFYATNFAGYLAKATGKRVLLMDLDLQFGEVSVALRLRPTETMAEMLDAPGLLTERLQSTVLAHKAGYDVLCAPKDPVSADRVGPREATEVLEVARTLYDYVVVDTPPALNEVVLAAFDMSGHLVVMATMDVPSLKNLNVFLRTLERLKVPAEGISLVLNKAEEGTGIELDHVKRMYKQGFTSVLPYAREVSRSINLGMPVVFSEPTSEVSRRFVQGATRIVEPAVRLDADWTADHAATAGPFARIAQWIRKGVTR